MGRPESERTIIARRRKIGADLSIVKRLAEEARELAEKDPKYFAEYLTVDIYIEMMLDKDKDIRRKAAKDMLAFTLAKKRPQGLGVPKTGDEPKAFQPNLPPPKPKDPIPEEVQQKIIQIKSANGKK